MFAKIQVENRDAPLDEGNPRKPESEENKGTLIDPTSSIVELILEIMSMDSFVFKNLNFGSVNKDESIIANLGPFATALYPIMTSAAKLRKDSAPFFKNDYKKADLFRAGSLTP